MSVAYDEPRTFTHESYPPIGDEHDHHNTDQHYTESDVAEHLSHFTADAVGLLQDDDRDVLNERNMLHDPSGGPDGTRIDLSTDDFPSPLDAPPMSAADLSPALPDSDDPSLGAESPSGRIKPHPKPIREVPNKQADGKYHCPLDDCKEDTRAFSRKCEWSKHMDKHERPYRCLTQGCENLPGFTYSGGLVRHEREVHKKHGGPKNTVNCPHPTCKRHTGKGFSRQENLNEHLRRVHTSLEGTSPLVATAAAAAAVDSSAGSPNTTTDDSERSGSKRKRQSNGSAAVAATTATTAGDSGTSNEVAELREEIKRVRVENDKLKAEMVQQTRSYDAMMEQLNNLQAAIGAGFNPHGLGAPTAQMI